MRDTFGVSKTRTGKYDRREVEARSAARQNKPMTDRGPWLVDDDEDPGEIELGVVCTASVPKTRITCGSPVRVRRKFVSSVHVGLMV